MGRYNYCRPADLPRLNSRQEEAPNTDRAINPTVPSRVRERLATGGTRLVPYRSLLAWNQRRIDPFERLSSMSRGRLIQLRPHAHRGRMGKHPDKAMPAKIGDP